MATIANLVVKLEADDKGLTATLGGVTKSLKGVESASNGVESSFSRFGASIITLNQGAELLSKAFAAVSVAVGSVVDFLGDSIAKAAEQEAAIQKLNAGLASAGQFTQEYSDELVRLSDELEGMSRFSNEAILDTERLLVSFGAARTQVPGLTKSVLDLAAGLGTDLHSATVLIGKALQGNTTAFSRYGIALSSAGTPAQKLAELQAQLAKRFGGQAAAEVQTFSGRIKTLGDSYEQLQKAIGGVIVNNDAVNAVLLATQRTLNGLTDEVRDVSSVLDDFVTRVVTGAVENLDELLAWVTTLVEGFELLGRAIQSTINPFEVAKAASEGMLTPLSDQLEKLPARIKNFQKEFSKALQEMKTASTVTPVAAAGFDSVGVSLDGIADNAERAGKETAAATKGISKSAQELGSVYEQVERAAEEARKAREEQLAAEAKLGREIIENLKKQRKEQADAAAESKKNAEVFMDSLALSAQAIQDSLDTAFNRSLLGPAGTNIEVFGEVATSMELAAMEAEFMAQAIDALNSGSITDLNQLLIAGQGYLDNFGDGIRLVTGRASQVEGVVGALDRALMSLGGATRGAGNQFLELNNALRVFTNNQLAAADATQKTTAAIGGQIATWSGESIVPAGSISAGLEKELDAATETLRRWSASPMGTLQIGIEASGSPTLPFSEYFTKYIPKVLEDAASGVPSLTFPTAFDGMATTAGEDEFTASLDRVELLLERVVALGAGNIAASRETTRTLSSPGFAAATSAALDVVSRVTRGARS